MNAHVTVHACVWPSTVNTFVARVTQTVTQCTRSPNHLHIMSRKIVLNVVDDYSETEPYSSDDSIRSLESSADCSSADRTSKDATFARSNFRDQYYKNIDGYSSIVDTGMSHVDHAKTAATQCTDAHTNIYDCDSDTSETELDMSAFSNASSEIKPDMQASKPVGKTAHRKGTSARGADKKPKLDRPKLDAKSKSKKLEVMQFNTRHTNTADYFKNQEEVRTGNRLVIPPPKPCYADNSNSRQQKIVKSVTEDIASARSNHDIIHIKNKVFKADTTTAGKSILEGGVHMMELSKLRDLVDISRVRRIVNDVIAVLSISPKAFNLNTPLYISTSCKKNFNFANTPQDIQLVNRYFCQNVLRSEPLSTLIFYTYNGKSHIVYHERTNIVVNKNYSSFKISVFSYDRSLCQESLNTINTIVYKTNGVMIDTACGNTKIVLPATVIVKNVTYVMDCFIIWRF